MSSKNQILSKIRENLPQSVPMPRLDDINAVVYPDVLAQFISMSENVGGKVVELSSFDSLDSLVRQLFPEAAEIASNIADLHIATRNPDTVSSAPELDGTDVAVIRGEFGVAENGCIWIPQTMKEKAVCFIAEHLVIVLPRECIVNNMHEAYKRIGFNNYGYGTFISGPSKTADIAQVLVQGAQAARSVTVVLE